MSVGEFVSEASHRFQGELFRSWPEVGPLGVRHRRSIAVPGWRGRVRGHLNRHPSADAADGRAAGSAIIVQEALLAIHGAKAKGTTRKSTHDRVDRNLSSIGLAGNFARLIAPSGR